MVQEQATRERATQGQAAQKRMDREWYQAAAQETTGHWPGVHLPEELAKVRGTEDAGQMCQSREAQGQKPGM